MTVRWETTEVSGSAMRIYLGAPQAPARQAGIIVAQHAGGVDAQMQDVVHRLHREGYVVAAPELFHRLSEDAANASAPSRSTLLKDCEILTDINATIAHLRAGSLPTGPIAIIGFCMGGRVSYLAATAIAELKAAVVFYGGNTMKAMGEGPSPFDRSPDIRCPIMGFFGAEDTNPSPADVQKIDAELTRLGKWHEFHTYQDAPHAFHNFTGERYRERAARSSWAGMLAFLSDQLSVAASDSPER